MEKTHQSPQSRSGSSNEAPASEWATDPVCGQEVETADSSTQRTRHNGNTYYFCSEECRQQFEASPDDFEAQI